MEVYNSFPDESRVWVYQANRKLNTDEIQFIKQEISSFTRQWISHNQKLKAWGDLIHERFLLLIVDESEVKTGGCSVDSSVNFIKSMGRRLKIDFFDRTLFAFENQNGIEQIKMDDISAYFKEGKITKETPFFNTLIKTKKEFDTSWKVPLKESWHNRFI